MTRTRHRPRRLHRHGARADARSSAGHEVVGLDSYLYRGLHVRAGLERAPPALAQRHPRRRGRPTCAGFDAVIHLAGALERPAGRPRPRHDLRDQPPRLGRGWRELAKEAGVRRFLFSSSCSIYGAGGDDFLDEDGRVQPGHAVRRVEGAAPSRTCRRWPTTTSARPSCATPPPTASRRGCAATSSSTTSSATPSPPGEVLIKSDGTPVAAARPHRGHRAGLPRRARGARASSCTTRRSTSAAPRRTTGSARSPRSSRRSCPDCKVAFAEGASPDTRYYRVDCDKIAETLPAFQPRVDRAPRRRAALRRLSSAYGLTLDEFDGVAASCGSSRCRSSQAEGRARRRTCAAPAGPTRTRHAGVTREPPTCRSCGVATVARGRSCRSASTPLADALLRRGRARRGPEPRFPLDVGFCPRLRAGADPRDGAAGAALRRQLPLLLVVLRRTCCAHSREHALEPRSRSAGLGSGQPGRRDRAATTATCCRTSPSTASRCSASTRRPGQADGGRGGGRADARTSSSAPSSPQRLRGRGRAGRRDHRQQRAGARRRPQRLRRRHRARCSRTTAWSSIESPYVRDLIDHCEFDTIYHEHLCYFSCTAVDALVRRHGLLSERRRALPRASTAARCAGGSGRSEDVRRVGRATILRGGARPRDRPRSATTRLRRAGASGSATSCASCSRELKADGKRIAALRRGGQGQHAAQLRRHRRRRSSTSSSTATCTSRACTCPACTCRSASPSALLEDSPTTCCCWPGTSRTRSSRQQDEYRRAGGRSSSRSRARGSCDRAHAPLEPSRRTATCPTCDGRG